MVAGCQTANLLKQIVRRVAIAADAEQDVSIEPVTAGIEDLPQSANGFRVLDRQGGGRLFGRDGGGSEVHARFSSPGPASPSRVVMRWEVGTPHAKSGG